MQYLLDTSVFSQPLRNRPVESALLRWRDAGDHNCAVSLVSVAEVEWGLHAENRRERWHKYQRLLENRLRILETDAAVWMRFARLKARQQELGQSVADLDLLIAATAMEHGLTVATVNRTDFSRIEGTVWEDWSV